MEARHLLAGDILGSDASLAQSAATQSAPITWFEQFDHVDRIAPERLANVDQLLPEGVAGPIAPAVGEWIVQLNDETTSDLRRLSDADSLLNEKATAHFSLISGLGDEGLLLVRGQGLSRASIEASLTANESVESFSLNQLISGQATTPNDPEFVAGLLPGLDLIDAENAWDVSIGSLSTVVGVVDTGIDPTHPDLYLNIWLNQGEIPQEYLDDDGNQLVDIDGDGLITFYDLNNATRSAAAPYTLTVGGFQNGPNAEFVSDLNNNGRIDAADLLADANWADGRDTDNNGFFDDFFGVNFRAGADDPLDSNDPSDPLGHGTHVAGTIGAIGGNGTGVVGVNWQTSLMSLRILDNNNQGDSGAAITAINYARQMRERLTTDSDNRVTEGANVKVLNNSWGQPGGYEQSLEAAIADTNDAEILFVAAAGNGNILGNGVDNDRTPFYPASYDASNVIAVSASDSSDNLATFSNFGQTSVDLFAPGVGIRSTLPGGGYGSANGTSMASPHVAATAALIWSHLPGATAQEVRQAILTSVDPTSDGTLFLATGGRLNANSALNKNIFAPRSILVSAPDISVSGGSDTAIVVRYEHSTGINVPSIDNGDLVVTRRWGPRNEIVATLQAGSVVQDGDSAVATYIVAAPDGSWDVLDFGEYLIELRPNAVTSADGALAANARVLGSFSVQIVDSTVFYVESLDDSLDPKSLRGAIEAANALAPAKTTIILESGVYHLAIPHVADPTSSFPTPGLETGATAVANTTGWSNGTTGDLDVTGNITVIGDQTTSTIINAAGIDRVLKVYPGAKVDLSRVTLTGGISPSDQGGGGILSMGTLYLDLVEISDNRALDTRFFESIGGGGVAVWGGEAVVKRSTITENEADVGGGIFVANGGELLVEQTTIDHNLSDRGGAIASAGGGEIDVENSTLSHNTGGAIQTNTDWSLRGTDGSVTGGLRMGISEDGRYATFVSDSELVTSDISRGNVYVYDFETDTIEGLPGVVGRGNLGISGDGRFIVSDGYSILVEGDVGTSDIVLYDRDTGTASLIANLENAPFSSYSNEKPDIDSSGRYITFESTASSLVMGDTNGKRDIFLFDTETNTQRRVSVASDGTQADGDSFNPSISGDGRYITFESSASNLGNEDANGLKDVFLHDTENNTTIRISEGNTGQDANGLSIHPKISRDGSLIVFESQATNLDPSTLHASIDIFAYDIDAGTVSQIIPSSNQNNRFPSVSGDGSWIAYESQATDIIVSDHRSPHNIYRFDTATNSSSLVSRSESGLDADGQNVFAVISDDGKRVGFTSSASNVFNSHVNGSTSLTALFFDVDSNTFREVSRLADHAGPIRLNHVTVGFNSNADSTLAGGIDIHNTLLAGNRTGFDLGYGTTSSGYNIVASAQRTSDQLISRTQPSDVIDPDADEGISELRYSGGATKVHQLHNSSVAIDSADPTGSPVNDQLSRARPRSNRQPEFSDIGAFEATFGSVSGSVYIDENANGRRDASEVGFAGVELFIDIDENGFTSDIDPSAISTTDNSATATVDETGNYLIEYIDFGGQNIQVVPPPGWEANLPDAIRVSSTLNEPNGNSFLPSLSADGRLLTFQSDADNLVSSDSNRANDIFVFDTQLNTIERVNVSLNGVEANHNSSGGSISLDGRSIVFGSSAQNLVPEGGNGLFVVDRKLNSIRRIGSEAGQNALSGDGQTVVFATSANGIVPGDNDSRSDVFLYDFAADSTTLVSFGIGGTEANDHSLYPQVSDDGNFIVFESVNSNLVAGDHNNFGDIFLYDVATNSIELISKLNDGTQANGESRRPAISGDGQFIAFVSDANNLVADDTNFQPDVFLLDRSTGLIERISLGVDLTQLRYQSQSVSLNTDGRYVSYVATASVYVMDRELNQVALVNTSIDGQPANTDSNPHSISGDGSVIAFSTYASNLVENDNNNRSDIFVVRNPLIRATNRPVSLSPGENLKAIDFGISPIPGSFSGRLFEDSVANVSYDAGEQLFEGWTVFLDENLNGVLDLGEESEMTDANGEYRFSNTPSFRNYRIAAEVPNGWELVLPNNGDGLAWNVFLPADGDVSDRNFAFRQIGSTGQSSASGLSGRLYEDRDGSGSFNAGDIPLAGREVFLDASNFGVRDANEPRELTDADGIYSFAGLSSRNVAVSTTLDPTLVHVNPLGSDFQLAQYPLFPTVQPFGNPQSIGTGDFNGDGFLDVAVALGEGNQLSIRLNDGSAGFLPNQINVDLEQEGSGPTSLVVGQFDGDSKLDVALTANFAGNVTVLLNFDPATRTFGSTSYVSVGDEPIDLAAGQFGGNASSDLVVVNQADDTVQLLLNDGSGVFTAQTAVPSGGNGSTSIVVGRFSDDDSDDVAVIHSSPIDTTSPLGGVTVLAGDGAGGLALQSDYYEIGALPIDSLTADLNGDGRADLAVANFSSNSISVLLGQADGTFRVQNAILGTASGAFDIALGDVDNDGDVDLFASNLRDRNVSIFRNDGPDPTSGDVRFQPLENIGLGQFSLAQRMPLVVANFDNDTSGPGGTGTVDIVTIPQRTDTLHVLKNTLIDGAHRVALTGLNVIDDLDFIIKPSILPPTFDSITNPLAIFEDADQQFITVNDITKGRTTGPDLQFTVTSDNSSLIPSPGLLTFSGGASTSFGYTPVADESGIAVLTVQGVDAGADTLFGGEDDGIFERSFTVTVLPVNDPPVFNALAEASAKQTDGLTTVSGFVTGIGNGGGVNEDSQSRDPLAVTATDSSFFTTQPMIDGSGTLTFAPNPNQSGSVPVTVTLKDSGGRAGGGVDTTTKTFLVNVGPVNDPPSFTLTANPNRSVVQTGGPQTFNDFVDSFLPGGGSDESAQTVSDYIVTVNAPGIFSVLPDISNSGTLTFTPAIDRTGVANVSVQVRDSGGQANGGNDLSATQSFSISVNAAPDVTRPTPVISYVGGSLTNDATFDVEVDFGEPLAVGAFTIGDLTVSSGTTSNFRDQGNGTFTIEYTSGGDGPVTFGVSANVATDVAGNQNLAATSVARTIDTAGMTPTLTSTAPAISNAENFVVAIDFGELATGFVIADVVVLNGTASSFQTVNASTGQYNVTITPDADGNVTVLLPANAVSDAAGNGNLPAEPLVRTVDQTAPIAVLSTDQPSPTNKTTFDVIADFGEAVTGLTKPDLTITGGTASDPVLVSQGRYRFAITATGTAVNMQLAADAGADLAGNRSPISNSLSLTIDSSTFVPTLSSTSPASSNSLTFPVSIDFGKAVAEFVLGDVTVLNGTASALTTVNAETGQYSLTVTADGDGEISVLIADGVVDDTSGNRNSASGTLVRTVDRTAPMPQLTASVASLTNQSVFTLTVDFGESVTAFTPTDVTVSGATLSVLETLGNGRFRMTATATNGPVTFNVAAGVATDDAGNTSRAATPLALTVDTDGPTATLSSTVADLSNSATFIAEIDFAESVDGLALTDLTVLNGEASALVTTDAALGRYSVTITPTTDGDVTVLLPANAVTDAAGNGNLAATPLERRIDRTAPAATLTTNQPSPTNLTTFEVIAEFGEMVTTLTKSGLTITGGTASDPVLLSPGRYAFTITATGSAVQMQLKSATVQDSAGNVSLASNTLNIAVDTTALVPVLSSSSAAVLNTNTFAVNVNFSKQLNRFGLGDVTVLGGTASNLTTVDAASGRYAFTVTGASDGQVSVLIAGGVVQDAAGNRNTASGTLVRTIDRVAPRPLITANTSALSNNNVFDVSVNFGEAVSGFTISDLVTVGATLSNLQPLGDGLYRMTATTGEGNVSFNIAASAASDDANNASLAAAPLALTVDSVGVTPALSSTVASLSNAASFIVAIDFTEAVTGFALADLTVLNGTTSNLQTVNASTGKYNVTITPIADGSVTVLLPANAVIDEAGNGNLSADPLVRSIDQTAPTATLSTDQPSTTNKTSFDVIATFGEAVTGLTKSDLTITGGTASDPELLSPGRYRFAITATGSVVDMQLSAGAVADLAGNVSPLSNSLSLTIDASTFVPTLSSTSPLSINSAAFPVAIDFGKPVNGFAIGDVTVLNGTASALVAVNSATGKYSLTVNAINDGDVSVLIATGVVQDLGGNDNSASSTLVRRVDRVAPTPVLTASVPALTNQSVFTLTVDFAETVSGFVLSDIVASRATLSGLEVLGGGRYRMTATASNGPVTFNVPAGAVTDEAGNTSLAATALALTVDTVGTTPTLTSSVATLSNAASFDVAIDFAESVTGFTLADLTVLNGSASNLVTVNAGTGKYNATITPTADGNVTVLLPSNAVTDAAGNGNSAAPPLIRIIDRTAPVARLTTTTPSRTNATTFDIVAEFGEDVVGLAKSDFIVSGATVSDPVPMGGGRYSVTLSGASGTVTVDLAAGAVNDDAGNANTAAARLTVIVDTSALVPVLSTTSAGVLNTSTFTVAADFGQPVNGFTSSKVTILGGGSIENFQAVDVSNGRYTFEVQASPTVDGMVTVLVAADVVTSLAGTNNSASNSIVRTFDRIAPMPVISLPFSGVTNQSSFNATIDFAGMVSGFGLADISSSGAVLSNLQNIGGGRYEVTASAVDGPVTLALAANAATDLAGNPSLAATTVSTSVDTTAARPILTTTTSTVSTDSVMNVAVDFGEAVIGFGLADVSVTNGTSGNLQAVDASTGKYTFDVTASSDGLVSAQVAGGAARDTATNVTLASNTLTRTIDRVSPTVVLTASVPATTNQTNFQIIATFSELVTGLTKPDLIVSGGTASDPVAVPGVPGAFSFAISASNGPVQARVNADAVSDLAGNAGTASNVLNLTVDTTAFVPALTTSVNGQTNMAVADVSLVFGKPVTGFSLSDLSLTNATATDPVLADAATGRYTFEVTASGDGPVNVLLVEGVVADSAGNLNSASNVLNWTVDREAPEPSLTANVQALTNQTSFLLTVDFEKTVSGFTISDVVVVGATIDNLQTLGNGRYTMNVAITGETVTFDVAAGVAIDVAGNANSAASRLEINVDAFAPTPTLTSPVDSLSNATTIPVAAVFGEPVTGFDVADLLLINATADDFNTVNAATGQYSFVLTPTSDGVVSVLVPAGSARDNAGNLTGASALLTRSVDRMLPSVSLTTNVPARTNQTSFDVIAEFSEPISGLTKSDFVVTGATASDPVLIGGNRYRVSLSGAIGVVTVRIPASSVIDAAGNSNPASSTLTVTVDTSVLSPQLSSPSSDHLNADLFTVTALFGREVIGFTADKVTVLGGTVQNFNVIDGPTGRFTFDVRADSDGVVSVLVAANVVNGPTGASNSASNTIVRTFDRTAPTPIIGLPFSGVTNQSVFEVSVDFGGEVNGFDLSDLVVTGASASNLRPVGEGRYLLTASANDGPVTINMSAGVASDLAGNLNVAAAPSSLTVDTAAATAALSSSTPAVSSASEIRVAVDFGEEVTGFTLSDLNVSNGSASNLNTVDANTGKYTFDVTPIADGVINVQVVGPAARDAAGNVTLASSVLSRTVDRTTQTVTLETDAATTTNRSSFDVIVDFGEAVSGLTLADVTVSQGSVAGLEDLGAGRYGFAYTASGDGVVTMSVTAAAATDLAGNPSHVSTVLTRTIDTTPVTATLTSSASNPTNAASLPIALSFGEPVVGFTLSDVTSLGGVASGLTVTDAATGSYLFTVTPSGNGDVSVLLPSGVVSDIAGNPNQAAATLTRTIDRDAPTATLTTTQPALTNKTSFEVIADFGKAVTGFTRSDITITGGTAVEPVLVSPGVYSIAVTSPTIGGPLQIRLTEGAVIDQAGNTSPASNTINLTVDTSAFVPVLETATGNRINAATNDVTVTFGKQVTGFALSDVSLTNATASDLAVLDASTGTFSFRVTGVADGPINVLLVAGVVTDAAGNSNSASNALSWILDRAAPAPTLASTVGELTSRSSFPIAVDFGEEVTGFELSDVMAVGATLDGFQSLGDGRFTMTATANDGPVSFSLAANAATDLAGNPNQSATALSVQVDSSAPVPQLSSSAPAISNQSQITVSLNLNEEVLGLELADLLPINATITSLTPVNVTEGTYTFVLTPETDGEVSVVLPAGVATDRAGNLIQASNLLTRHVDRLAPSVVLSTSQPSRTNLSAFDVIATFSESVSGLSRSDLVVTGATFSDPVSIGNNQFAITLSNASGLVEVSLVSGAVTDETGNSSLASEKLSVTVDQSALVPVLTTNSPLVRNTNAFSASAVFGREVIGLTANSVTALGGTVTNFVEADRTNGRYTFDVTTTDDGVVTVLISASVVRDTAGNFNAASNPLAITVDRLSPTPVIDVPVGSLTNQSTFDFSVDFSELVTGFELSDIATTGLSLSDFRVSSPGSYVVTAAAIDGPVTISVGAGAATDRAGLTSLAAQSVELIVDTQARTPVLASDAPITGRDATISVSVDFGELVSGLTLSDLLLSSNATASNLQPIAGAPGQFTFDLTGNADGLVTAQIASGAARDEAGNLTFASNSLSYRLDRVAPTVVLLTDEPATTNQSEFNVIAAFSEAVTGLTMDDLVVSGATASAPVDLGNGRFQFRITATSGNVDITIPGASVQDLAGNDNAASSPLAIAIDQSLLVPVLTSNVPSPSSTNVLTQNLLFGKPVVGFELGDITVLGGTASNLSLIDTTTGSFTFTVTSDSDGVVTTLIPAGVVVDQAGNANAISNTIAILVDQTAPVPTIRAASTGPINQTIFDVDVSFSEPVFGLTADDFVVSGASVQSLQPVSPSQYRLSLGDAADNVTLNLAADAAQDAAGNPTTATTPLDLFVDAGVPQVTLATSTTALSNSAELAITAQFSEAVNGFDASDLIVTGGTVGEFTPIDAANGLYQFTMTPTGDGEVSVLVPPNAARDAAGNGSTVSNRLTRNIDSTKPLPRLSSNEPSRTNRTSFDVFVDFAEPMTGLTRDDLNITGASFADPQDLGGGRYSVSISEATNRVEIDIAGGTSTDLAGNANDPSNVLTFDVDTTALVPQLSTTSAGTLGTRRFDVIADFGKEVVGLVASKVTVINGSIENFVESDRTAGRYTFDVVGNNDGLVTVLIPEAVVSDLSGSVNRESNRLRTTVDTNSPAVVLTATVASTTNQSSFDVEAVFAESISDLTLEDFDVVGATLSDLRDVGAGRYSMTVTAEDGEVQISLPADRVIDAAGNSNTGSNLIQRTVDSVAPIVTIGTTVPDVTNAATVPVFIDWSESITGFSLSDLLIIGGSATELTVIDDTLYSVSVTPDSTDGADSIITVIVPFGAARDAAGNLNEASSTLTRVVDVSVPTPILTTREPERTNQRAFDVVVEFAEAVTGLAREDLVVSGGTASEPTQLNPRTFSFTIQADESDLETPVQIQLAEAAVTDQAGNTNPQSNALSLIVDRLALVPTLSSTSPNIVSVNSFEVRIELGKPVVGFDATALTVVGGRVESVSSIDESTGAYSALITTDDDGIVTVVVPAGAIRDLAGNSNVVSNELSRQVDLTSPSAVLTLLAAGSERVAREIEVVFSEPVVGFDPTVLSIENGTIGELVRSREDRIFNVLITPTSDGTLTIGLPDDVVQDAAGRRNQAATPIVATVDISRPVPTITGQPGSVQGTFDISVSFSEEVTGLTQTDFQIGGATLSDLVGSGNQYTATLTADRFGTISIMLPEDRVVDAANNRNVDSNELELTYQNIDTITLEDTGETVDMGSLDAATLLSVKRFDIRGIGANSFLLSADRIQLLTPDKTLSVIADADDQIVFDAGWQFAGTENVDGVLERKFTNGAATLRLVGPRTWTNPIDRLDVNANGSLTAVDALSIINALNQGSLVDSAGRLIDPTTIDASQFLFYDVSADGNLTSLDALLVINFLNGPQTGASEPLVSELLPLAAPAVRQVSTRLSFSDDFDSSTIHPTVLPRVSAHSSVVPTSMKEVDRRDLNQSIERNRSEEASRVDGLLTDTFDWLTFASRG